MELSIQERLKDLRVERGLTLEQNIGNYDLSTEELSIHKILQKP